jgi:hypothetical protein
MASKRVRFSSVRQEKIASKTVFDANDLAHLTKSGDTLKQDNFHGGLP